MTVSTDTRRVQYATNGTTGPFTVTFPFLQPADLAVTYTDSLGVETLLTLNVDYTVAASSVTTAVAYAAGGSLTIVRSIAITQELDLRDGDDFPADVVEEAFDKLTMIAQQVSAEVGRALRVPEIAADLPDLPSATDRANRLLGFDSNGDPVGVVPTAGDASALSIDLANTASLAKGDALIGVKRNKTNTTATTLHQWIEWQYFNAKEWGVTLDGTTDDSTAWANLLAAMPASNFVLHIPPGTSIVNSSTVNGIKFDGKSNFSIFAHGATIKVKNGEAVTGNREILFFNNCQDAVIEGLTVDGNRANRTPVEVGAHSIVIADSCARMTFRDCVSKNAVVDGWIAYTTVPGTQATYPTDITMENCVGDNCWRQGLSIIDSVRFTVRGGRYVNTNGTAPQSGIDVEPDASSTFGNTDVLIESVDLSGNTGYGIQLGGPTTGANTRVTLRGVRGSNNTQGLMNIGSGTDVLIENVRAGAHSACTRSIIDIASLVTRPVIRGAHFDAITAGSSKALIYVHASVAGRPKISGVSSFSSTSKILDINKGSSITGVHSDGCTTDAIVIGAGTGTRLSNIDITSCSGRGIYTGAADTEIDGATLTDCASTTASVQFDTGATGGIAENIDIIQTTSIPVGAVGIYWNAVPRRMADVRARSAGTDYTSTTIATFAAGVAGAKVYDCVPHPLSGSATFNPGAIATGGVAGTNITVTGAELATASKKDEVRVFTATDYTNLVMGAMVTGANVVRVNFANNSGAGITPSSATLYAEVHKR